MAARGSLEAANMGKQQFSNPMHLDLEADSSVDLQSPLSPTYSEHTGTTPPKPPPAAEDAFGTAATSGRYPRKRPRMVDIDGTQIDMNGSYQTGSQEWYLQSRRRDQEIAGLASVDDTNIDEGKMELSLRGLFREAWAMLSSPGNIAAGLASALHVNIYLLALGLLLASPYMGIMTIVRMAVVGTGVMQTMHTLFGSFKNFAISNCDTIPAAVFVYIIQDVITAVEEENYVAYQKQKEMNTHLYQVILAVRSSR